MKFCPKCGAPRLEGTAFCGSCGAPLKELESSRARPDAGPIATPPPLAATVPPPPVTVAAKPGLSRVVILAGAVGVILGLVVGGGFVAATGLGRSASQNGSNTPGGNGTTFATPEDAIRQYMDGVATNDPDKILAACAIDESASNYRFDLMAGRLEAILPMNGLFPSGSSLYNAANKVQQEGRILGAVRGLSWSLLVGTDYGQTITPASTVDAQQYMKDLDPTRLAGIKVITIKFPSARFENDSRTVANFAAMAKIYGADEQTERLALFQWNGSYYYVGFSLVRYGSDWKVLFPNSALGGTSADGAATKTTPDAFDALIAGE